MSNTTTLTSTSTENLDEIQVRAERAVFARLLAEVPAEKVMWRTASNVPHTAGEILKSLEEGGDLGRLYASDVLRICRDMLSRTAVRPV